jgi:hypothetical protein
MKTRSRFVLSALFACALVGGLSIVFLNLGRRSPTTATPPPEAMAGTTVFSRETTQAPVPKQEAPASVDSAKVVPATVVSSITGDKFIEEELAEAGEDLGAVYCMSRVREALRYGNRTFARQLFNQMKELHPDSPLLEESEALFNSRIQARRVR